MFNDERINFEMTKLKKLIIIISLVLSLMFLTFKLFVNYSRNVQFCLYSTEIVILATSLIILLGSLTIKSDVKDEMYLQKKQNYYNKAFKILLYISFISYALVIPGTIVTGDNFVLSSNMCINMIMTSSLFFGYGYLRLKKVYFNYNIIENKNKPYYKNVFKNIWKITKFFGIIYLIALLISVVYMTNYHNPISFIVSILLAFIFSVLTNSIYYLFISFMEKMFYKEENNKKITTPTVILLMICFVYLLIYVVLYFNYYLFINNGFVGNQTSQVAALSSSLTDVTEFLRFFSVLGLIFLVSDLFRNDENLRKKNSKLVLAFILFITYEIFWGKVQGVFNIVIHDLSNKIDTSINSMDFYVNVISKLQSIQLIVKSLFYVLLSIFILIINSKKMKNILGLRLIFAIWIMMYISIPIAYFMQNKTLLLISSFILVGILSLVLTLYVLVSFIKRDNIINNEI